MEKIDIAQLRLKSIHRTAAWKKGDIVEHHQKRLSKHSSVNKRDIAQQCCRSSHITAAWEKSHSAAAWKR